MVNPKKISDEGRALTCDEYDENLDILQDRANHTGFQSCTTLNDLDSCLATNAVITAITGDVDNNEARITQLENDLSATGSVANDLAVLEATLRADIQGNTDNITVNLNTIDTDLRPRIVALEGQTITLDNTITANFNNLEPRLTALDDDANNGRMITAENNITSLQSDVNTIVNNTIPTEIQNRIDGDNTLDDKIDDEIQDRIDEIARVENLLDDEVQDRTQADSTLDSKFTIITDDLIQDLGNEVQDRIDGDLLLQTQITALSNSLGDAIPTGTILAYAGTIIPTGFLLCDGATVNRTTYAALFAVVSTRYGAPSASTFTLPDLRNRVPYGSGVTDLNVAPTYLGQNTTTISTAQLPSHTHTSGVGDHTHTVDTNHFHGLFIHAHDHPIGNLPQHTHSLAPYRKVALGGGGEDDSGAELTEVQSDDPDEGNINPNTQLSDAGIPGPAVSSVAIGIYPPPWTGVNRTDDAGGVLTTSSGGSSSGNTGSTGSNSALDIRQAALVVNYIIKT